MKREEIEHLLVEYVNGEISIADKQRLEQLFKQDPQLKQEAEEMAAVWDSMQKIEDSTVTSAGMDAQFYTMLHASKKVPKSNNKMFEIRTIWLKPMIAAAACIAMFVIGRISVEPEQVTRYKTVYIKAPVINDKKNSVSSVALPPSAPKEVKIAIKPNNDIVEPVLAQKLRSVYASERIAAIMELSKRQNLSPDALKMLGLALIEDPNPNVRLMVINILQPLSGRENVQAVLTNALNHQGDASIQTSIVELLVDAKSKQAIPQMIALLENKNTDMLVQEKIKDGIVKFLN